MNSFRKSFKSLFKSKPTFKVSSPNNTQGVPADILANSKPINKIKKGGKSRRRKNKRSKKRMTFRKTRVHR